MVQLNNNYICVSKNSPNMTDSQMWPVVTYTHEKRIHSVFVAGERQRQPGPEELRRQRAQAHCVGHQ